MEEKTMSETKKGKDFLPKEKDLDETIKEEKKKKKQKDKAIKDKIKGDCTCSTNNPDGVQKDSYK